MRNHLGFIALSLLAAAFAGCSSTDKPSTTSAPAGNGDLTGELAKYNSAIVPLPATACVWTADIGSKTGTATVALNAQIAVLSLRSVDSALMINGVQCSNTDSPGTPVTSTMLKGIAVTGHAATDETIVFDFRNGIFTKNNSTVDLNTGSGDEVAILSSTGADKVTCSHPASDDAIDVDTDKKVDITVATQANTHFTFDLNAGDDTFDQGACVTKMAVYGGWGKDLITVGTAKTKGDVFSGGTEDAAATTAKVDTITFAARTAAGSAVTVSLDGSVNDGDIATTENDNVLDDFEVVTGTAYNDILKAGSVQASYTLNGGDGNDTLSSIEDHGAAFNGGNGIDTIDYHLRAHGVTVTMDGAKADDGYRSEDTKALDNVAKDIENIIGTDSADKITGNTLSNVITPGGGADIVFGGDGDDRMVSGLVNDLGSTVTDADGGVTVIPADNDKLDGNDVFSGGLGSDWIDYSNRLAAGTRGVKVVLDAVIASDGTATGTASGTITSGDSDYIGADVENIFGTVANDNLTGSNEVNVIYSLGGTDIVDGKAGNDQLDLNSYKDAAGTPHDCNPLYLTCLDPTVASASCLCTGTLTVACINTSTVHCGNDPLDILSCKNATPLVPADTCWKNQSN